MVPGFAAAGLDDRAEQEVGREKHAQVLRLFELVLSRAPEAEELERLSSVEGALAGLARVMLSTNELLYVD